MRALPAVDGHRVLRGALAGTTLASALDGECCKRACAAALSRTVGVSDARRAPLEIPPPQAHPVHRREQLEEQELSVDRDRRRNLQQARLGRRRVEQDERGLRDRQIELSRERLDEPVDCLRAGLTLEGETAERARGEGEARPSLAAERKECARVRGGFVERGRRGPCRGSAQEAMEVPDRCRARFGRPVGGTIRCFGSSLAELDEVSRRHRCPLLSL